MRPKNNQRLILQNFKNCIPKDFQLAFAFSVEKDRLLLLLLLFI